MGKIVLHFIWSVLPPLFPSSTALEGTERSPKGCFRMKEVTEKALIFKQFLSCSLCPPHPHYHSCPWMTFRSSWKSSVCPRTSGGSLSVVSGNWLHFHLMLSKRQDGLPLLSAVRAALSSQPQARSLWDLWVKVEVTHMGHQIQANHVIICNNIKTVGWNLSSEQGPWFPKTSLSCLSPSLFAFFPLLSSITDGRHNSSLMEEHSQSLVNTGSKALCQLEG